MSGLRVLVLGAGARQHALAWKLAREPGVGQVLAAPGNPLMGDIAELHPSADMNDLESLVSLAQRERVDLVVVGPEDPLVAGLADRLAAASVACFGPGAAAARLEGSKAFARDVCDAAGVPMASGRAFDDATEALAFAETLPGRAVVKADGLAAGKGVVMCDGFASVERAIRDVLVEGRFGSAGRRIVVEEWLEGSEASVFALCDGERYALLPGARDHKRAGDGDTGANTGGMGAYSPVVEIDEAVLVGIGRTVVEPVLREMSRRGTPYQGALFCGLMLTTSGPRVLEFNVRMGDPETQAIVPRLAFSLADLMQQCATGRLATTGVMPTSPGASVGLSLAAEGYPESARKGDIISGIDAALDQGALVFGAGIAREPSGRLATVGGRVLTVVGLGADLAQAADSAYEAADVIDYEGKWYRHDIGRSMAEAVA